MIAFLYLWLLYQMPLACPQAVLPSMCVRQVNFFWSEQLFSKEHSVQQCVQSRAASHSFEQKLAPPSPVVPYRQPTRSCGQCTRPHKHIRPEKRSKLKLGMLEGISISQFRVIRPPIHSLIHLGRTNFKSMWWKLFVDMTCHMASKASVPSTHADAVEHFYPRFTFSLIRWSLQIDEILRVRVVFVDMTWQSHGHPQSTHTCGETPWTTRQIFIRFSLTLRLDDKYRKQLKGQLSIILNLF